MLYKVIRKPDGAKLAEVKTKRDAIRFVSRVETKDILADSFEPDTYEIIESEES